MTKPDPIDAAPAAETPSEIAGRLLSVTRQLAVLLERETALLRTVDAPALLQLQKGKAELVATHAMLWGQLRATPDSLEQLSASLYEELKAEAATLSATAAANERKLRAACQATDRLLAIIVDAVRKQRGDGLAYGESGAAPRPASGAASGLTLSKDI
jgi:hypothetical protein